MCQDLNTEVSLIVFLTRILTYYYWGTRVQENDEIFFLVTLLPKFCSYR